MLNKRATYGDDWGVPSAEHPAGPCLNRSAPGVEDGSYFEKAWVNDLMALPGAIMNAAGYTPNGTEDTATASQVFDALVNGRWSEIANYTVGTIVTASNGKQYYCNKDSGRDSAPVDPVSDTLDNWREYPYAIVPGNNSTARKWFDGRLDIKGASQPVGGSWSADLPISIINPDLSDVFLSSRAAQGVPVSSYPVNAVVSITASSLSGVSGTVGGIQGASVVHWSINNVRWS